MAEWSVSGFVGPDSLLRQAIQLGHPTCLYYHIRVYLSIHIHGLGLLLAILLKNTAQQGPFYDF